MGRSGRLVSHEVFCDAVRVYRDMLGRQAATGFASRASDPDGAAAAPPTATSQAMADLGSAAFDDLLAII